MLSKDITNKITFLKDRPEELKILFIYRWLSFFATSIFYFLNHREHTISRKLFIIGCLAVAAIILSHLYLIYNDSRKVIKILLIIETISNSILLIPSGGIRSPFIWYTLNTVLICSLFLKKRYIWLNIFAYIFMMGTIAYFTNNLDLGLLSLINEHPNLILSYIMIVLAVQALSIYNSQLKSANLMITDSVDHIKALYQSINIFSNQGNMEGLINVLFDHIKNITKSNIVFYYDMSNKTCKMISSENHEILIPLEEEILRGLKDILESKTSREISISGTRFLIMPVGNNYPYYGILGFEITRDREGIIYKNYINQIQFLSELLSITLERIELQEINDRFLISEEQNRIANEIHDSVLQRLFSMSCGVFSMIRKIDTYTNEKMVAELNQIRESTDMVMRELRNKIYGLSWKKSGRSNFVTDIKKYIGDIKRFSNTNIPFTISGSIELLTCNQKKAIYRIICEAIGNAVRHGKAKNIEVNLEINSEVYSLNIIDDGLGFDLNGVNQCKTKGLGIQNMYQLALSLCGEIEIVSKPGEGTSIKLIVPNVMQVKGGKSVI